MKKINNIRNLLVILTAFIGLATCCDVGAQPAKQTVTIGVVARRGPEECLKEWSPTALYLDAHIPGTSFKIIPLKFEEIEPAIKNGTINFILGNSSIYVELQNIYGVNRMLTLKRATPDGYTTLFGGVIFCKADRSDIVTIRDLKNKSFIAVDPTSFGGWITAWRELKAQGIDHKKDFAKMLYGGTHDNVVYAVRDGMVDAGTVATPILEQMTAQGKITPNTFKIINQQERKDFPYFLSTRLYPEWPLAKLKHTPDSLAEKVAVALLSMPAQNTAAQAAQSAGWTVPLDYEPVDACLKELKVSIHKNYGRVTLTQLIAEYRLQGIVIIAVMVLMIGLLVFFRQLNRKLRLSESALQKEITKRQHVNDELVRSNESLQQTRQQLENIIDFLPDATFVIDNDKKVIFWNKAIEEMSGVSKGSIIGQGDYAYTVPFYGEKRKQLLDLLEITDEEIINRYQYVRKKGGTLYAEAFAPALNGGKGAYFWATAVSLFDVHGNRVGAIESIRDVTELKQAEHEKEKLKSHLVQAQKMEAIGTLAGGIAHDFNNILSAILGYTEIARGALPPESVADKSLNKVMNASQRAASLVKQILSFSRQEKIDRSPLQPVHIVKEALKLLRPSLPSTIEIRQQFDATTKAILADPTQLHQILINLCTNAFHAMEQTGGILEITLNNYELSQEDIQKHPEVNARSFVMLSISDTGSGIDPDTWGRIFDPYFTTKEFGKGTGMGLSIVHGIVTSYGGFIICENNIGGGTVFRVFFPALEQEVVPEVESVEKILSGTEHILFVDDEVMLADLGKVMLENLGYEVTSQTSSLEALATFQKQPNRFDAVITDQTMSEMTGMELARKILQIRPNMPIILCTGNSSVINEEQAKAEGLKGFADKPVTKKVIAVLLRKVLDESRKEGFQVT